MVYNSKTHDPMERLALYSSMLAEESAILEAELKEKKNRRLAKAMEKERTIETKAREYISMDPLSMSDLSGNALSIRNEVLMIQDNLETLRNRRKVLEARLRSL